MDRPILVKLGGSAITDKNKFKSARIDVIKNLSEEIGQIYREVTKKIVLIHGGGSYGHPLASKFKLYMGLTCEESKIAASRTIDAMRELSMLISRLIREQNVPVVPIQPSAIAINKSTRLHKMSIDTILKFLELDMPPLLWGDVVYDEDLGVSILSGDEIVSYLALQLNASMVIYGSDVDGIYRDFRNRKGVYRIVNDENIAEVIEHIAGGLKTDVTGGMKRKFEEILKIYEKNIPIYIVNATKKGHLYKTVKEKVILGTLFLKNKNALDK